MKIKTKLRAGRDISACGGVPLPRPPRPVPFPMPDIPTQL